MLEFQEKRKVKKFLYSRITLATLLIFIFFLLKGVWGVYEKQQITKENLARTAADLKSLQEREQVLSTEINWLKTDNGTEEEIREKYGLVKPGEEVITIVNKNPDDSQSASSDERGFWQKVWDWLQ